VVPHEFKQFIAQAASLSQRQRIDLADVLQSGLQREKTVALIEIAGAARGCPRCRSLRLDADRISSPEMLLRSALGAFPDLAVT
jgi:hypothetical protein